MAQVARPSSASGEQTKAAILQAAEQIFAAKGFDRARLEDVAEAVGIRRASIVYYFKDKRVLYDAVLHDVFGDFRSRLEAVLARKAPVTKLIDEAIGAWVDYVGSRPSFARIMLREVADAGSERSPVVLPHVRPFVTVVETFMKRHAGDPLIAPAGIDPTHIAATIAGATVFFVAAMPALVPDMGFDPLSSDHLARHKSEVQKISRRLLAAPKSVAAAHAEVSSEHDAPASSRTRGRRRSEPTAKRGGRA